MPLIPELRRQKGNRIGSFKANLVCIACFYFMCMGALLACISTKSMPGTEPSSCVMLDSTDFHIHLVKFFFSKTLSFFPNFKIEFILFDVMDIMENV